MICPNCLEDYVFVRFELHPECPEPRAIFTCLCDRPAIFPVHDCLHLDLLNPELLEQLRVFKLLSFRRALDRERQPYPISSQAMPVRVRHLERYLSEISLKSIEPLGAKPVRWAATSTSKK